LRTRAIPERLRGVFATRRYTNPRLPLPLPYKEAEGGPLMYTQTVSDSFASLPNMTDSKNTPINSENWTNYPAYLGGPKNLHRSYYYSHVESCIRAFHWHRDWWPLMSFWTA